MKKYLCLLIVLLACGCSKKELSCTKTYDNDESKMSVKYIIDYDKDYVTSINIIQEIESDDEDVLNDYQSEALTNLENYEKYDGYSGNVSLNENILTLNTALDLNKMSTDDMLKIDDSINDVIKNNHISKKSLVKYYKNNGCKCK